VQGEDSCPDRYRSLWSSRHCALCFAVFSECVLNYLN
jgi:hypothetical protein